jgi:hypothetical protein
MSNPAAVAWATGGREPAASAPAPVPATTKEAR